MKQGVDKSEEAGLLNPDKAIADVQSSPLGARSFGAWDQASSDLRHACGMPTMDLQASWTVYARGIVGTLRHGLYHAESPPRACSTSAQSSTGVQREE